MKSVTPIVLFSTGLFLFACGNGESTGNSTLEKEKLELEKKKLELEEAKFKADQEKSRKSSNDESSDDSKKTSTIKSEYKYLLGKWNGSLRNKNLTIVIESIDGNTVSGYNVAGTNKRPLTGRIYADDQDRGGPEPPLSVYKLVLSEPGDDKWDGVFTLYLEKYEEENLDGGGYKYYGSGSWKSNNGKLSGDIELKKF
ncbi:MAG: hypothetical protein ACKO7D_06130 [Bacteroidota bacterium]